MFGELIISDEIEKFKVTQSRSGSTTGEPIEAIVDKRAAAFETFAYFKGLRWMGWKPEMSMVRFFGGSLGMSKTPSIRAKIYQKLTHSISIPAFSLSKDNSQFYYNQIKGKRSICLIGYPSAIYNFAEFLKELNLSAPKVDLIITTSEQLIKDWELSLSEYFNCPIKSYFGCGEVQSLGFQSLGENSHYLVPSEHVIVESDKNNNLLLTQLHNKARPLIRYQNGDTGIVGSINRSTVIHSLEGRTADYFTRSNGEKVSPVFGTHSIFQAGIPVEKYQYIRHPIGFIEFRYSMQRELNEIEKSKIQSIVDLVMQEKQEIRFMKDKPFEISASGKHRICVKK